MAIPPIKARRAALAIQRFGLGVKGSDETVLEQVAKNPIKSLLAELNRPNMALMRDDVIRAHNLPGHEKACFDATNTKFMDGAMKFSIIRMRNRERRARLDQHIHPDVRIGFVERLVIFWSNHFSMYNAKSFLLQGTVGEFERSRIRPNVCGNFIEMMEDVYTHPAMIAYLDNENSIGPMSDKGNTADFFGLNENLAREILELHTLSTDVRNYPGGREEMYKQEDVIELAKILTGWSYKRHDQVERGVFKPEERGQFVYQPTWHEYGLRFLVGQQINNYLGAKGVETAKEAFRFLAGHPATGRFIARKMILHFLSDDPKPAMVEHLAKVFRDNIDAPDQLRRVAAALVTYKDEEGDDVLSDKYGKFRTSYEFLVGMLRAFGDQFDFAKGDANDENVKKEGNEVLDNVCEGLGQEIWGWQTPDGYPDDTGNWLTPQGMAFRLDVALKTARSLGDERRRRVDPKVLAHTLYGSGLSNVTRDVIGKSQPEEPKMIPGTNVSGDQKDGLAILFTSPEFLWR